MRIEGFTIASARPRCRSTGYWPVCADGLLIRGEARVAVVNNVISGNGWSGPRRPR